MGEQLANYIYIYIYGTWFKICIHHPFHLFVGPVAVWLAGLGHHCCGVLLADEEVLEMSTFCEGGKVPEPLSH